MNNPFGRGLLERLAGVGHLARWRAASAATQLRRRRRQRRRLPPATSAPPTWSARVTPAATRWRPSTPAIRAWAAQDVGEKILDINCIAVPEFGENGDLVPPYNIRTPTRDEPRPHVFKNFKTDGEQKLQFRVGFFNIFNQAFANTNIGSDINLTLNTTCNVRVPGVPNGAGGTRQRLRPDRRLRLHAADQGQLRQDQPEARPPRHRVRAEVLLLGRCPGSGVRGSVKTRGEPTALPLRFSGIFSGPATRGYRPR